MNPQSVAFIALLSCISLIGLWYLLFKLYRDYRIDRFRQDVFTLRNALFIEARDGLIPFDHPAYQFVRHTMNGFIRFADDFTMLKIIVCFAIVPRTSGKTYTKMFEAVSADLDTATRERLNQYIDDANLAAAEQLLLGSPILLITVIVPVVGLIIGWNVLKTYVQIWLKRSHFDQIDAQALTIGKLVA